MMIYSREDVKSQILVLYILGWFEKIKVMVFHMTIALSNKHSPFYPHSVCVS